MIKHSETIFGQTISSRSRENFLLLLFVPTLVLVDSGCVFLAYYLAYWVRMHLLPSPQILPPEPVYINLACFMAILSPVVFGFSQIYHQRWRPLFEEFSHLVLGISLLAGIQFTAVFFFRNMLPHPEFTFSRLSAVLAWFFGLSLTFSSHLIARRCLQACFRRGWGVRQVLVAGQIEMMQKYQHLILQGIDLKAHCQADLKEIEKTLEQHRQDQIELVLLQQQDWSSSQIYEAFLSLNRKGVQLWLLPNALQLSTARQQLTEMGGIPVLALERTPLHWPLNRLLKRALDLSISSLGLLILSPVFAVIMLMIRLGSDGPIFYTQERISRNGQLFKMLKFRTMQVDSESRTGPVWASINDPRITPIGKFLRRSSLDELPQLWNVLNGDMSFVGPRPERPHFVERFEQEILDYPDRHLVKAGMTGWAQINGLRGDTSIQDRTRYDLYYIENWSLLFDLRIIARSFWTVLKDFVSKRAY